MIYGNMRYINHNPPGFALPSVLIASVVMLSVVVSAASAVSNVRAGLDAQYYDSLAKEAAEAGVVYASSCIKANGGLSPWGAKNLTPATTCAGDAPVSPAPAQSLYLANVTAYRTTFSVGPATNTGAGAFLATSVGKVELLRSNGAVWKTITRNANMRTGGQISTTNVVFGYVDDEPPTTGAFFGVIGGDGRMRTVGYNDEGQLGVGTTTAVLTPTVFNVPGSPRILRGYTSFLSMGRNMIAVDSMGRGWISGANNYGQAGTGQAPSGPIMTPQQVALPAGVSLVSATANGSQNFFLGSDNNIYAAGNCAYGTLGTGACPTPGQVKRVELPPVNVNDPNTIPTSQIVADYRSAYVVMAGGALYGWGSDAYGQMSDAMWSHNFADRTSPTRIGVYGDPGQPTVKQVATDGNTVFILDSNGTVKSVGQATFGSMGQGEGGVLLRTVNGTGMCLDEKLWDPANPEIWSYSCNGSTPQKWAIRTWNNSLQAYGDWRCLSTGTYSPGLDTRLVMRGCLVNDSTQKFVWEPAPSSNRYGRFRHTPSGLCVDNNGGTLQEIVVLWTCDWDNDNQNFVAYSADLVPMGTWMLSDSFVTKIATDMGSLMILTRDGKAWSMGLNSTGQFGIGSVSDYVPDPTQFPLPAGVTAVDIYESAANAYLASFFVVGSDGKVYGAGSNGSGQLGDNTRTDRWSRTTMLTIDGTNVAASQVQSGFGTTVIFTRTGSVYAVGKNNYGQIGDSTTTDRLTPVKSTVINDLMTRYY